MVILECAVCGDWFSVIPYRAGKAKYCSYHCHQVGEGRKGGIVRGEQVKALSLGRAYTKTRGRHTHRVVMETILGRPLAFGEVVHHDDGNKLNNSPENLRLLKSQADHIREHHNEMMARRREKYGH